METTQSRPIRVMLTILGSLVTLIAFAVPASAGAPASLNLDKTQGPAGTDVTASGNFWCPNDGDYSVSILMYDSGNAETILGSILVTSAPQYSGTVTIPGELAPGVYDVYTVCTDQIDDGERPEAGPVEFTITGGPATTTTAPTTTAPTTTAPPSTTAVPPTTTTPQVGDAGGSRNPTDTPERKLAYTGTRGSTPVVAIVGAALLGAGVLLIVGGRRRSRTVG